MTIHLLPRSVSRSTAETRAMFLAREAVAIGATKSPTLREILEQLTRSTNAAIATEANRLKELIQ